MKNNLKDLWQKPIECIYILLFTFRDRERENEKLKIKINENLIIKKNSYTQITHTHYTTKKNLYMATC